MKNPIRVAVSKKKRRFVDEEHGFDLDLTYITDNVLAMGFPSESLEGMYRNPLNEVIRFLETRHGSHYKVYNLCSERCYDKSKFQGRVALFPFDDHNAPPLEMMRAFCEDVDQYLAEDSRNVAAVHCKAGKGRTGVMICAYLLHVGRCKTAKEALEFYGAVRTRNGKGVTIPSQARYVGYYEELVKRGQAGVNAKDRGSLIPKFVLLTGMTLHTLPHFGARDQGCNLHFTITMGVSRTTVACTTSGRVEQQCLITYNPDSIVVRFPMPVRLAGDVKIEFYHQPELPNILAMTRSSARSGEAGKKFLDKRAKKMCHFWLNTSFIPTDGERTVLAKADIDRANKDKQCKLFDPKFSVELRFSEPRDRTVGSPAGGSLEGTLDQPAAAPHHREADATRYDYTRRQHTGSTPVLTARPPAGSRGSPENQPLRKRLPSMTRLKSSSSPRLVVEPASNASSYESVDGRRPSSDNFGSDYSESLSDEDDDEKDEPAACDGAAGTPTELQLAMARAALHDNAEPEKAALVSKQSTRASYTSSTSFTLFSKQYSVRDDDTTA